MKMRRNCKQIYIPICFYYFLSLRFLYTLPFPHLHSNMFLLFHESKRRPSKAYKIYIPICFYYFKYADCDDDEIAIFTFQYVSIISFTAFALLAQPFLIYIPICFYYFASGLQTVDYASGIYIPICFYYFCIFEIQ